MPAVPAPYRAYLLIILSCLFALNGSDRIALGLLLQSIKLSLHLSDVQLGVLSGIAFSIFYSLVGLPLSAWADRGDRVKVIATTMALWGVMVSLSGTAATFPQLLLIRIGVAVGEAGCIPPSLSLIADYFRRDERPRAVAIYYTLGISLCYLTGDVIAGWLNQLFGWRVTFLVLGVPGVVAAVLAWLTLRDPRQRRYALVAPPPSPDLRTCAGFLWRSRTFRHLLLCFSVVSFFGYGIVQWQPSFFIRSYGFHTATLGFWFAIVYGVAAAIGTYFGGDLASRLAANNERLQLAAAAAMYSSFGIISVFIYLSPSYRLSFVLMAISTLSGALATAPLFATIQTLIPGEMRAVSISLLYLAGNLIGMGLGPLTVGALSEAMRPAFGVESLRYALIAMCPGYLWGGWHFWRASRTVSADLRHAYRYPIRRT